MWLHSSAVPQTLISQVTLLRLASVQYTDTSSIARQEARASRAARRSAPSVQTYRLSICLAFSHCSVFMALSYQRPRICMSIFAMVR